jgi:hypothetical protein
MGIAGKATDSVSEAIDIPGNFKDWFTAVELCNQ